MIGNNQPVPASGEEVGTLDDLRISAASEIVELVVLTSDEVFLQTLREAIGDARRLWHVSSADKVSDLLVVGEVGILVLDVQALNETSTVFVGQIKRQFPDLVVLVAGHRDAETSLAGLISAGIVYRFIHKPMSPGRAKLFADAAVKRYDEQRRRSATIPPIRRHSRSNRGVLIGGTASVLGAIVVTAWVMHRSADVDAGAPRTTGVAPSSAEAPLLADAAVAIAEVRERLLARADNALLEEHLDEAAAAIEAAHRSGVEDGRIAFLKTQLAKSRARVKTAQAAARARNEPKAAEDKVTPLLEVAAQRSDDAHVIDPEPDRAPAAAADNMDAAQGLTAAARPVADADAGASVVGSASPEFASAQPPLDAAADRRQFLANVVAAGELTLVKSVQPIYPPKANLNEIQGWVELDFTVAESGAVKDIVVHAASTPGVFEEAAIRALSQWRFKPVLRDAKSVAQRARVRIRFALAD
jgi:TonB family protein